MSEPHQEWDNLETVLANNGNHFIESLILPVLLYNSELRFYSCTDGKRTMLLGYFKRACDIHSVVRQRVLKTVEKFSKDPEHIFNHC